MSATEGQLNITLPETQNVTIYTTDGKMIAKKSCAANTNSFNLNNGICIVKIGNNTYKVIIK